VRKRECLGLYPAQRKKEILLSSLMRCHSTNSIPAPRPPLVVRIVRNACPVTIVTMNWLEFTIGIYLGLYRRRPTINVISVTMSIAVNRLASDVFRFFFSLLFIRAVTYRPILT